MDEFTQGRFTQGTRSPGDDMWPRVQVSTSRQDGRVVQDIDMMGQLTRRVVDVAAQQWDEAVRAELIAQGWTPPPEDRT